MSEVLVLVEHSEGDVKKVTHELLTLARTIGEPSAVVVGDVAEDAVDDSAANGAEKVYVARGAGIDDYVVDAEGGRAASRSRAGQPRSNPGAGDGRGQGGCGTTRSPTRVGHHHRRRCGQQRIRAPTSRSSAARPWCIQGRQGDADHRRAPQRHRSQSHDRRG